ncbi:hypothetical protein EXW59_27010 [Bacillus mycoides]|nr:hypothetical protein EXW59_27010 [Bacillus mycoides]QWI45252.1 hypothetical protein EXW55_20510 [Bacillus mycoides]
MLKIINYFFNRRNFFLINRFCNRKNCITSFYFDCFISCIRFFFFFFFCFFLFILFCICIFFFYRLGSRCFFV